jgi:hypothetical protein
VNRSISLAASVALIASLAGAVSAQTVTHIYELNGSYADALGGPALTANGGTLTPTHYAFGANQGPSLSNGLLDAADYSIELLFEFDTTSGYRKILDFKDRASDNGLYNLSTALNFYSGTTGPSGALADNGIAHVVLTRNDTSNLVVGYVNGVQQLSFTDSSDLAVFTGTNNIIHFFRDDFSTGQGEASAGTVDRIRIYDGALSAVQVRDLANGGTPPGLPPSNVPEPGAVALLTGLGASGLLALHRRRK